ncbi:zinc finger MYM-type protein 1-like [Anthonomus grandis grandis]|uniref:zinc finger MYM-type protein 1-like n=1 Tax=Anthonomus grandis grandis TaxID=2921223 RepID=UPI0021664AE5|nr:zinc finger MYM-type protein 1-like [Anthonomus grandis grandis]
MAVFGPEYDPLLCLLEIPFSRRTENEIREILTIGRPQPSLCNLKEDKRSGSKYFRSFQSSWYNTHLWLCGSLYAQKLFCWPCVLLSHIKSVWVKEGYYDLKNSQRSAKKHAESGNHLTSFMNLKRLEKNISTIKDLLQENVSHCKNIYNEKVRKNRMLLSNLIDTTILLAKQELSFRGHREAEGSENRGNFIEVFNSKIKYNEELRNHIKKLGKSFCSKTIQNDLIFCISEVIKEKINQQLKDTEFFAVIVDDTTDITEKSQCAVSLRYVEKKSLNIYERFLGFYDVSDDRTSEALYTLVASVLSPFNYREKLVAQCYDGASVMAGHINGLQMKIKNDAPEPTFIHCSAHKLNLVLQDGCKSIKECRIFFATLSGIPNFFHQSAKRTVVADNLIGKRIPSFCETRWASRSKIVLLLTNEYLNFISVFENKYYE